MRYWYRFLRFLGYRWYQPPPKDGVSWEVNGPVKIKSGFYAHALSTFNVAEHVDWTSDTIRVYLDDGKLWSDWRWVD